MMCWSPPLALFFTHVAQVFSPLVKNNSTEHSGDLCEVWAAAMSSTYVSEDKITFSSNRLGRKPLPWLRVGMDAAIGYQIVGLLIHDSPWEDTCGAILNCQSVPAHRDGTHDRGLMRWWLIVPPVPSSLQRSLVRGVVVYRLIRSSGMLNCIARHFPNHTIASNEDMV